MSSDAPIPVFTLARAVERIRPDLEGRWSRLLDSQQFVGGEEVEHFERRFASFLETDECVGVANGTDALTVALRALDLEPGDEVIVPAFTFIATAATVAGLGGRPVFADVEESTLNVDLRSVVDNLTDRTVGVIGVHLYGNPCAADELRAWCDRRGLWLVEDAAQAHGARLDGRRVGGFGELTTWSFYPSKNLGCFGDGGAVTGSSADLLARVRRIANHGRKEHYFHDEVGVNSRLDALQAAVLNSRLPLLEDDNARRREIAERYRQRLERVSTLRLLEECRGSEPVYHQFTIRLEDRDGLKAHLASRGIGAAVHYPLSLDQQPAFSGETADPGRCPVAGAAGEDVLCLPMFAELTDPEVDRVCGAIEEYFAAD
jgi:dTDP-4-amino-4,6-dideoxygalactose transaminase